MKTVPSIFAFALLTGSVIAVPAFAVPPYMGHGSTQMDTQPVGPVQYGNARVPQTDSLSPKAKALLRLRAEGLKLKEADGGTLTPEHQAYLQAKLDAIQANRY